MFFSKFYCVVFCGSFSASSLISLFLNVLMFAGYRVWRYCHCISSIVPKAVPFFSVDVQFSALIIIIIYKFLGH